MTQYKKANHHPVFDVLLLGEALVDLISEKFVTSLEDAHSFQRFVGGEVTNVALNVARLGGRAAIAACVGDDGFGHYIHRQLHRSFVRSPTSQAGIPRVDSPLVGGDQAAQSSS